MNTLTGTVVGPNGPIDYAQVQLWTEFSFYETTTGSSGQFTFADLPDDSYRAFFAAQSYVAEWWQDASSYGSATAIVLRGGSTVDLAVDLEQQATLSGHVRDEFGNAVPDVLVTAEGANSSAATWTDFDGAFHLGVAPGTYTLRIEDWSGRYRPEWWQDVFSADQATPIDAGSGDTLTFDFTVDPIPEGSASVSGTITDEDTGEPLPFVYVTVSGPEYENTYTDELGNYSFNGLDAGEYQLWFEDFSGTHVTEWWENVTDSSLAATIVVDEHESFTADAALARRPVGTIHGVVTDEVTGEPLPFVSVVAIGPEYGSAYTNELGEYMISDLDPGPYDLSFDDSGDVYATEWWDNVADPSQATQVLVADGETFVANVALAPRPVGTISGTVTDEETGVPIAGISVFASGLDFGSATTDELGGYSIAALDPGSYQLAFVDENQVYSTEFWDNVVDPSLATPVSVAADATSTADAALALRPFGAITGLVTDEITGDPLEGITVTLWPELQYTTTDSSGGYSFDRAPGGTHEIGFDDGQSIYVSEFWDNAPHRSLATQIMVEDEETIVADAELARRGVGSITGTVTVESTGEPAAYVTVYAYGPEYRSAQTDEFGHYTIDGLETGAYVVSFEDFYQGRFQTEWWDDVTDESEATPVVVANGETIVVDAALSFQPGVGSGSIAGQVTNSLGQPLSNKTAVLSGPVSREVWTDETGRFRFNDLPAGEYVVQFVDLSSYEYQSEWWNDAASEAEAAVISVADGESVTGIDATLLKVGAAWITGVVIGFDGVPLDGVEVIANPWGSGSADVATTASDGTYTLEVARGDYQIWFRPPSGSDWFSEYFDDARDPADADIVTLEAGETRSGIDAQLDRAGVLSGRVTADGEPVAGVSVRGRSAYGVIEGWTDADGRYSITVWQPASYRLLFTPEEGTLGPEWYENASQVGDSVPVHVSANSIVSGIDVELDAGGSVSGRVLDTAGRPIAGMAVSVFDGVRWLRDVSDDDGRYVVGGLDGEVVIAAVPSVGSDFAGRYWPGAPTFESAERVVVDTGTALTGYDLVLPRLGSVTGVVTGPDGPVAGVSVLLHPLGNGFYRNATTDADGRYTIDRLALDDYVVEFVDDPANNLVGEFWRDAQDRDQATPITVGDGDHIDGVDANLSPAGQLVGRVTDRAGLPVPQLALRVSGLVDGLYVETDENGRYVASVRPGSGTVQVISGQYVQATATYPSVDAGGSTTLDIVVETGVTLSGAIVLPDGMELRHLDVVAYTTSGDFLASDPFGYGTYQLDRLPAGEVELRVSLGFCTTVWCDFFSHRTTVLLTDGGNRLDVRVPEPGSISGVVRDDLGTPVFGQQVLACTDAPGGSCREASTDADGRYEMAVFPGDYDVRLHDPVQAGSQHVTVASLGVATADFVRDRPMTVTGVVRTSSGDPLESANLVVRSASSGELFGWAQIGDGGGFSFELPPGSYAVCVLGPVAFGYLTDYSECWANAGSLTGATPITGTAGQTITGIDFTLGGPGVVGGVNATVVDDDVTLTWDAALYTGGRAVTDYLVQIDAGDGTWTTFDDGVSTDRSVTVPDLERGATYRFRVAAVNSFGVGVASNPVAVEIPPTVPSAPLHVSATIVPTPGGASRIELSWDRPADDGGADVTDYLIQRSPNGRGQWSTIVDGVSASTTYTVTGNQGERGSFFRVLAVNEAGTGPASVVVIARP